MLSLRWYQSQLIKDVYQAIFSNQKKILIQLATGGGKSVIFSKIITDVISRSKKILLVAHRIELINQGVKHITRVGISPFDINVINADNEYIDPTLPCYVGSVQTLDRRQTYPDVDVVIVDEAHHCSEDAKTYAQLWNIYPNAIILGFTATPIRLNGDGFENLFDVLIQSKAGVRELINEGHLSEYELWASPHQVVMPENAKTNNGDYIISQLAEISSDSEILGDIVPTWLEATGGNLRTVVFTVNKQHSILVQNEYRSRGIACEIIDSSTPKKEREDRLKRYVMGEYLVLINTGIFTEGFDLGIYAEMLGLPEVTIDCVQLLRKTKSLSLYLQMVGRALRIATGKDKAIIIDHVGLIDEFGTPDQPRIWSLKGLMKKCQGCENEILKSENPCHICGYDTSPEFARMKQEVLEEIEELEEFDIDVDLSVRLIKLDNSPLMPFFRFLQAAKKKQFQKGWVWFKFLDTHPPIEVLFEAAKIMKYKPFYCYSSWKKHKFENDLCPSEEDLKVVARNLTNKDGKPYHVGWARHEFLKVQQEFIEFKPINVEAKEVKPESNNSEFAGII